uniref:Uncharacterized protein n=1 Tax=Anguilla anguilla TaxID=7936 RepID=A0A0E9QVC0_ANGAN
MCAVFRLCLIIPIPHPSLTRHASLSLERNREKK